MKESLISCVKILRNERIISKNKEKDLIEGIKLNKKQAYHAVTRYLERLAKEAYKEGA